MRRDAKPQWCYLLRRLRRSGVRRSRRDDCDDSVDGRSRRCSCCRCCSLSGTENQSEHFSRLLLHHLFDGR